MHEVKVKGILSSKNGMNLYRGCSHGCIYCDSRSKCYQMHHDFEDIEVKINAVELLEDALKRKRKKCMIGTGAMTDPYIPIEIQLQHTRSSLELIDKYGFGVAIQTKSNRILRDLGILKSINEKAKSVVQITLTTFDEKLCSLIEPNVSTTKERVEVLNIMRDNNIPTIVWLCPILPFINDTEENINGILDYCEEAKVKGIICFSMGLTLREGNREYFYNALDKKFPGLKQQYIKSFGNVYDIKSKNNDKLMDLFQERCKRSGIIYNINEIFTYLYTFENKDKSKQISLFDL
ncbi:SPL family radical SAM protein [Tissierella pigra]|uniref:Radical SAM protein n=1 Tax=Tissierella pigra TaxID=2607614 RepID=A0A6N7XXE3_9FIRM|nr:radical SAM protein [Tissierella pigra]MSU02487.1 radical SAM protein [Tissierella pigra]